jgi:alcohol dehydrogenase (cytochrome c)
MKVNRRFLVAGVIVLVGALCAAIVFWNTGNRQFTAEEEKRSAWEAAACRARLFLQKAQGGIPDLSWSELWKFTTTSQRGFHCLEGRSLEASLQYTQTVADEDYAEGSRIFHERCSACHGNDGSGGPHAPPLTRSEYTRGDSDLTIYKILRDGIPGTGMSASGLAMDEILHVVAHLKALRTRSSEEPAAKPPPRLNIQVSDESLLAAGTNPEEWLVYSGSYDGRRHTSLGEITPANVGQLRLRWIKQFDGDDALIEATPLVIDGTIFLVRSVSDVVALDAKTGDVIWEYKRPIPADLPLCCGRVNRGLGVFGNTLFFGSVDGYLVAINANDGKVLWQTLVGSASAGYSLTGAPLVINHSVVVGVAGGEYGVRGFLAAYDVSTGQQVWKFETIPGPGEVGHETWENDAWRTGGGTTWNTGSYDPSTDLLYWGVGNPSPAFSGDARPGDNLFTNSVIALHASTGKLAWYFQFSPHDEHDWDSAQTPVLADLPINGQVRKVICWPNRNGFYYILDRVSGKFLTGVPYVEVNWAIGLSASGRPIITDAAKVLAAGRHTKPASATNWQNPAFDPERALIFVPTTSDSAIFTKQAGDKVTRRPNGFLVGSGHAEGEPPTYSVRALDAATGQQRWEYVAPPPAAQPAASYRYSGLLSTAGGLVFGAMGGFCFGLDADTGREVWRLSVGGNTMAAPIAFSIDGRQVIVVAAGRSLFMFGL